MHEPETELPGASKSRGLIVEMSLLACILINTIAAFGKIRPFPEWWAPRHPRQVPAWALLVALLSACGTVVATPEPVELRLAASSSAQPFAQSLGAVYHQAYPEVTVRLVPTANSQAAAHQLAVGNADAALLTDPDPQKGPTPLQADQVAWDRLVLVVHPSNSLESLTMEETIAIFRGQVREWPRRAGTAGTIQILSREEGSGLRVAFEDQVMKGQAIARTGLIMPGNEELRDAVAETQQAIGYLPQSWLDVSTKILAVDGMDPSTEVLQASGYPLRLPVYLLAHKNPSSDAAQFRGFVLAAEGQAALGENALNWQKE